MVTKIGKQVKHRGLSFSSGNCLIKMDNFIMLVPRVVEVFQKIHHVLFGPISTISKTCLNQHLIFLQLSQTCYKDSVLFAPVFKGKLMTLVPLKSKDNCKFYCHSWPFSVYSVYRKKRLKMFKPFVLFLLTSTSLPGVELCCRSRRGLSDDHLKSIENIKDLKNIENIKADSRLFNRFCQRPPSPGSGSRCCMYLPSLKTLRMHWTFRWLATNWACPYLPGFAPL